MNQTKLKEAWSYRALNMAAGIVCLVVGSSASVNAATLWNNGTVNTIYGNSVPADSTLPNSGFTVFDSFAVPTPGWVVSGFDITDFFYATNTSEYTSTNWSLWKGDPLAGGTLVASGNNAGVVGTASGPCGGASVACSALITVTLSSGVFLAAGNTYYIGTSNVLKNSSDVTERAFSAGHNGVPDGWENSNGSIVGSSWFTCAQCTSATTNGSDTAFDILGNNAPEPGTLVLMSLALAGLGYKARRRKA